MSRILPVFLPITRLRQLRELVRWYTTVPACIELPGEVHEAFLEEANTLIVGGDYCEEDSWHEAFSMRADGTVYADGWKGRVRFVEKPRGNKSRGRRPREVVRQLLDDGGAPL